jgi:hypothetical protein
MPSEITYDDFRRMAGNPMLSKYERIGFPDSYRSGYEEKIFVDICRKLANLERKSCQVLDIGPGSSDLPLMLIELCRKNNHSLALIDSAEMLDHLPNAHFIQKHSAMFPNCHDINRIYANKIDVLLCYSVLHYVILDTAFFRFLDTSLSLLAPGGQMLIGDIPNVSKRKRFFSSESGIRFHQEFMETSERPMVEYNCIENDKIDDAVIMVILQRARAQGFDAYVLPQDPALPMANRREDILITRP